MFKEQNDRQRKRSSRGTAGSSQRRGVGARRAGPEESFPKGPVREGRRPALG